jgi:hypothetical protein
MRTPHTNHEKLQTATLGYTLGVLKFGDECICFRRVMRRGGDKGQPSVVLRKSLMVFIHLSSSSSSSSSSKKYTQVYGVKNVEIINKSVVS